jgi:hypothetical protein
MLPLDAYVFQLYHAGVSLWAVVVCHYRGQSCITCSRTRPCSVTINAHGVVLLSVLPPYVFWPLCAKRIKQPFRCPTANLKAALAQKRTTDITKSLVQ